METFRSIVFDLGKVVFDLSFDRVFKSWATSSGKQFNEIKSRFVFDELSDMFERNEISPEQFRTKVLRRLDVKLSDKDFDKGWCELYLDTYGDIGNLLMGLKRNYKLVALTNTNAIHHEVWSVNYAETLQHFEKIFSSHEIGTRKPEEKSFKIVLDYLQCKPAETIFLDDNADNINGAGELGIATILVTSQVKMREELLKNGLLT
jgi:putative hydrolase of the HAD superfamily